MFELAKAWEQGHLSIRQIAAQQALSEPYLEQIFPLLKSAGLVKSTRGAGGGYVLSKEPKAISVGSVLTALEGELTPADCVCGDADCENAGACTAHAIWQRIYDGINSVVEGISLQDMLNDDKRLSGLNPQAKNIRC
jgi:Rrf2 family protein